MEKYVARKKKEQNLDDKFARRVAQMMEQEESDDFDSELPKRKKIGNK